MSKLFGLRRKPGAMALGVFRIVPALYRVGLGRFLGRTFLLLTYKGRKSGKDYRAALMVLEYNGKTGESISLAMYGAQTGWMKNIVACPAVAVETAGKVYRPVQLFLSEDEALGVLTRFGKAHPWRVRLATRILGWGNLQNEAELRQFVKSKPFVGFRPAPTAESIVSNEAV